MIFRDSVILVTLALVIACSETQEPPAGADAEDLATVQAVADSFVLAVREQDPERFADLFTPDATYASNDGRLWTSRDEVLANARQWMRVLQEPTRTTVHTEVGEEFAYLLEAYSSVIHLPDQPPQTVTGHSLAVFEKQDDGTWKIDALVVNRDPR